MIKILISLICASLLLSIVAGTVPSPLGINLDSSSCSTPQIKTSSELGSKLIAKDPLLTAFISSDIKQAYLYTSTCYNDGCMLTRPGFLSPSNCVRLNFLSQKN